VNLLPPTGWSDVSGTGFNGREGLWAKKGMRNTWDRFRRGAQGDHGQGSRRVTSPMEVPFSAHRSEEDGEGGVPTI